MKITLVRILQFGIVLLGLAVAAAHGQTCSAANPCVQVSIAGTTGQTATLYEFTGSQTSCSLAALTAFISSSSTSSQWRAIASFPQKAAIVVYNDPEAYSSLVNYAAVNIPSGGAAGPVSAIIPFQMPTAPQTAPSLTVGPNLMTTGATGPQ